MLNMASNSSFGLRGQQNGKSAGQDELPEKYDETIIHKVKLYVVSFILNHMVHVDVLGL